MTNKNVIILAAGFGSRLKSITMHKPKCMIRVCGKPILEYQLDAYQEADVDQITIVTGYKSEVIENFVKKKKFNNVNIIINNDFDKTNNMYSLWMCKEILLNSERTFISNADVVFDKSIIQRLKDFKHDYIVCEQDLFNDESMKISTNVNGKVVDISKEINKNNAYGCAIDLYSFSKKTTAKLYEVINSIIINDKNLWTEVAIQHISRTQTIDISPFCLEKEKDGLRLTQWKI